ncbi:MAG: replication initiation protein, partial [Rickettsia sp.]|nr:replication initiation protein [Rickettsia sp.]
NYRCFGTVLLATTTIYSIGSNNRGQLGIGDKLNKTTFTLEKFPRKYVLSAQDFSSRLGIHSNTCYAILRAAADIFIKSNIRVECIDSEIVEIFTYGEETHYKHKKGELYVKLTENILPYLQKGAKRYVLYLVEDVKTFKSLYSVRLFESSTLS